MSRGTELARGGYAAFLRLITKIDIRSCMLGRSFVVGEESGDACNDETT